MGLEHEFYLISDTTDVKEFWRLRDEIGVMDSVVIHDDIIQYIIDTLKWIPSKNPAIQGNPDGLGINYHGVTLFDKQSSKLIIGIFSSWRDLFKYAPHTFELTGNYVYGENQQEDDWERIIINRDEVVKQFEKIISMTTHLANGNCYLYHMGI